MEISWRIYDEEGLDPSDPLGSISLSDDQGEEIRQEATYVDSWFEALIDGLASLRAGEEEAVEMLEEPDPLEFKIENGRVVVTHDSISIDGGALTGYEEVVRLQLGRFLEQMQQQDGWESNPTLRYLAETIEEP